MNKWSEIILDLLMKHIIGGAAIGVAILLFAGVIFPVALKIRKLTGRKKQRIKQKLIS
ncbi:hypothetical protein V5L12_001063 [Escherichia coli]|uniref:hypothetical protein n=1 Tax=Escherichia coli TaxID=562 RepID=UPI001D1595CF|nr:hypothetical protein [Escherichia coli]EKF2850421.1 hypothetical protein [Escherichia coli]ELR8653821.1 hypothetical protein [Escherichia coli]MBB9167030.1 hypothetical protein [Escherichia coli]